MSTKRKLWFLTKSFIRLNLVIMAIPVMEFQSTKLEKKLLKNHNFCFKIKIPNFENLRSGEVSKSAKI